MATIRDVVEALSRRAGVDAVVAVLNADALLIVLVQPSTNVGALLYDLRRHRTAIARLL
jgi:predicted regulator of Ras-like GTPase activity (Roadblock/LC7/MglB family)